MSGLPTTPGRFRGRPPRRRPGPARPVAAAIALAAALVAGMVAPAAGAPVPDEVTTTVVAVTSPEGDDIDGGGSDTPFTLRLPDGASCPGDSAEEGYRVNSFMVPAAVAGTEVTFDGLGPTPMAHGAGSGAEFRQPLYATDTSSYVSAQTAKASAPGGPGPIVNVPGFSLAVFAPGDVPPGRYRIGLACTLLNEVAAVWEAEVELSEDADDSPAALRWATVGDAPGAPAGGGAGTGTVALAAVAVALSVLSLVLVLRRRRSSPAHALPEAP